MEKKIRSKPIEWTNRASGKGGCMLIECKKIVKWKNDGLHLDEVRS